MRKRRPHVKGVDLPALLSRARSGAKDKGEELQAKAADKGLSLLKARLNALPLPPFTVPSGAVVTNAQYVSRLEKEELPDGTVRLGFSPDEVVAGDSSVRMETVAKAQELGTSATSPHPHFAPVADALRQALEQGNI